MLLVLQAALAGPVCGFVPPSAPPRPVVPKSHEGELLVRDAFGAFNVHETEHFVLKWGPLLGPDAGRIEQLGYALEEVWTRQIDELGWVPPAGSEAYKLNVYFASSGAGAPEIDFSGGYVWVDAEDFPYIALSPDTLDAYDWAPSWPAELVAHEFNHTLQIRNSAFSSDRYGPFFWEATANWVVPQTFQTEPDEGWGRFLLHPHLSLDMWALDSDDEAREGRQYSTALFVHHLSDQRGLGADFIRDAWQNGAPEESALSALDALLPDGLRDTYLEFAVAYAVGDHDLADLYDEGADLAAEYGEDDDRRAAHVPSNGTDGMVRPPRALRPQAWSWNHMRWTSVGEGTVVVRFVPDAAGSIGTPSDLVPFVVRERDGVFERFAVDAPVPVESDDFVHLVAVAVATVPVPLEEVFGYGYAFEVDVERPPPRELGSGPVTENVCGCSSAHTSLGFPVLVGLVALRRRRAG